MSTIETSTEPGTAFGNERLETLRTANFVGDGGLETSIIFLQDVDLPDFAAFPLVDSDDGRATLRAYYGPYLDIAQRDGIGIVLDTPTWRANQDWGARLGYDTDELARVNRDAVAFIRELAAERSETTVMFNGAIGPRGDGYVVGETMTADAAKNYHLLQTRAFADAGADVVTAVTMTYAEEAIGVVEAARAVGVPVAIGFTVETDGRLPSGQTLRSAIEQVDEATDGYPEYFMINCAHPSHFADVLGDEGDWRQRIHAIRANASRMSHAELDEAEELDRGDVAELADDYVTLRELLPNLRVVGGCCGTDHEHIGRISAALHTHG